MYKIHTKSSLYGIITFITGWFKMKRSDHLCRAQTPPRSCILSVWLLQCMGFGSTIHSTLFFSLPVMLPASIQGFSILQPSFQSTLHGSSRQLHWGHHCHATPRTITCASPTTDVDDTHNFDDKRNDSSSLIRSMERQANVFAGLSLEQAQKLLVHRGVQFVETYPDASSSSAEASPLVWSDFSMVPGCAARVQVRCGLRPIDPSNNHTSTLWIVESVQGNADALLSRGLLATFSKALHHTSVDRVLAWDPSLTAQYLGLHMYLSPGRNDGLASMMRAVQRQIAHATTSFLHNHSLHENENGKMNPQSDTASLITSTIATNTTVATDSTRKQPSVALLLSGGVDSSVALHLLLRQGYNVTAFYLRIWLQDELAHLGTCPWEDDYRTCQAVCAHAAGTHTNSVRLETLSLQKEYQQTVLAYTLHEAQHGRTPNPDIQCNSRVKFGCFYDAIAARDFDYVASGHYAQIVRHGNNSTVRLLRSPDPVKDQSYFLCALTQTQLQRVLFPMGHLTKSEVRQLAEEWQLPNRHRPDSQGLCFLGQVKFEDFLAATLGTRPGPLVDAATGAPIGQHRGLWFHTVGQRKGIGTSLFPSATSRGPWYVVAKDIARNIVYCSNVYDQEEFAASRLQFTVESIAWISGRAPSWLPHMSDQHASDDNINGDPSHHHHRLLMKIRHGPRLVSGQLVLTNEEGTMGNVQLENRDSGLAPGQYVAFYDDMECLGGGVISEQHWMTFITEREERVNQALSNMTVITT
jgi:tRNA-5-taurinomethyluridine 2-sulfurtransferase